MRCAIVAARHQELARDLLGLEPAEQPQRERDLGVRRQRRMAAEEHQSQLVVGDDVDEGVEPVELGSVIRFHVIEMKMVSGSMAVLACRFASQAVDGPVVGRRNDPAARVRGNALAPPLISGDGERFRDRILGQIDVAEDADQRGRAATGFPPEDRFELVTHPSAGRTSIGRSHAAVHLPAHSRAASRSGTSMIQKPPICSFVSAKGPSVIEI